MPHTQHYNFLIIVALCFYNLIISSSHFIASRCNLDYVTDEVCASLRYSALLPSERSSPASAEQIDPRLPLVVESVLSTLTPKIYTVNGDDDDRVCATPASADSSRSADLLKSLLRDIMTHTVEAVDTFASLDGRPSKQVNRCIYTDIRVLRVCH